VGVGEGVGDATVGLGVAGVRVGDGVAGVRVGDGVGAAVGDGNGEAVGDGRLAVGVPEAVAPGFAAGAVHAATRARTRSATTGCRRNMCGPPRRRFIHAQHRPATPRPHVPAVTKLIGRSDSPASEDPAVTGRIGPDRGL
jgi:hypothetical protein